LLGALANVIITAMYDESRIRYIVEKQLRSEGKTVPTEPDATFEEIFGLILVLVLIVGMGYAGGIISRLGVSAYDSLKQSLGPHLTQLLTALGVLGGGGLAFWFKWWNQFWYGFWELVFAASYGVHISLELERQHKTIGEEWVVLISAAYIVSRGLGNMFPDVKRHATQATT
jgi:hypothetical protein